VTDDSAAAVQARARAAWRAYRSAQAQAADPDVQAQARERWQAYRNSFEQTSGRVAADHSAAKQQHRARGQEDGQSL
jgi:hypothetical protein